MYGDAIHQYRHEERAAKDNSKKAADLSVALSGATVRTGDHTGIVSHNRN